MMLLHHGIKGQKWGVRRYQNKDGTLTKAGRNRVKDRDIRNYKKKQFDKNYRKEISKHQGRLDELATQEKTISAVGNVNKLLGDVFNTIPNTTGGKIGSTVVDGISRFGDDAKSKIRNQRLEIESEAYDNAREKTNKQVVSKFGKQRVSQFNTHQRIKTGIKIATPILGALGAMSILSLGNNR